MKQLSDTALARHLAETAGQMLLALRDAGTHAGKALADEGDVTANAYLVAALRSARPDDALLSEEEADSPARLAAQRVWIIDPLDGSREYGEGRDDWAVHVALSICGVAYVGAVALPARGITLDSDTVTLEPFQAGWKHLAAWKRRKTNKLDPYFGSTGIQQGLAPPVAGPPRMVVSRTRPPALALAVAQTLGAQLVPMGSAGVKAMAVVLGDADIYLHAGGQFEWDNAAPVAVATAAGLHCSRIDGAPLRYNLSGAYVPDLLICRHEWVVRVMAAIVTAAS